MNAGDRVPGCQCYVVSLMLQSCLSIGTVLRRHFSFEETKSAVDFMQTLTCSGKHSWSIALLTLSTDIHCFKKVDSQA